LSKQTDKRRRKYIRSVLGISPNGKGAELHGLLIQALALRGLRQPEGMKAGDFIGMHRSHIAGVVGAGQKVKLGNGNKPKKAKGTWKIDPNGPAFLESYEWRSLRMKVLIKYGSRCQCCGATPQDGLRMHVDHIKPRRKHPELALSIDNLQVLCEVCNHGKGSWDETDWRDLPAQLDGEQAAHIAAIVREGDSIH